MAERHGPRVYSIAAHRGFADALAAGLAARHSDPEFGLARLTLLLPSSRAIRTVSEAFIRHYGGSDGARGLLMPRMVAVGDLDLDEALGPLLDPIGSADEIPQAVDPTRRWLRLAELIAQVGGDQAPRGAALLRLAAGIARTMDRLLVEEIGPGELRGQRVLDLVGELSAHWLRGIHLFATVQQLWLAELDAAGMVDAATRRNLLFARAARKWSENPPPHPIVAAGITSSAPALARLLGVIAGLPDGAVVLPDLDLSTEADGWWDELGRAGAPDEAGGGAFGRDDAFTHPQYHLKLLLNRMGVNRAEVRPWHRAGPGKGPPDRSHAISSLFMPPLASRAWAGLQAKRRRLAGVRIMQTANPEEEAQAIALLLREALETPGKRAALVTPDRALAARVVAHLGRWGIEADDSAGVPLSLTAAGRIFLLLAEVMTERAAPVPLMALLGHPLTGAGEGRVQWLEHVRALELRLRGPRRATGLAPVRAQVRQLARRDKGIAAWWAGIEAVLGPLLALAESKEAPLAEMVDLLAQAGEALCGIELWGRQDGRALSALVAQLRLHAGEAGTILSPADLPAVLRERMDEIAVRPPWGGHPRIAIYGLLEARMSRADLVICGGLNEGTWPQVPPPEPLLAPAVLRALGVPGGEFRIGLAAHDLAAMLGAPEVVLSRAARDAQGPTIPSRFLLRVEALLGEDLAGAHREVRAAWLARMLDDAPPPPPYPRPMPKPSVEQRRVDISVTALDRLRSDPYQFYAQAILGLRRIEALDEPPSSAWQGTLVHAILERWHSQGGAILAVAGEVLGELDVHPLMRALWLPRLFKGLEWIEAELARLGDDRQVIAVECSGEMVVEGVRLHGRADRIDRLSDGTLAIVDYKTGTPPSARKVEEGYALQLGLVGLMAQRGGIDGVTGQPRRFEYWSLGKSDTSETGFGYRQEPVLEGRRKSGIPRDLFLPQTERYLKDAIGRWIIGDEPFTARLVPDLPVYSDYDQLMRLEEWFGREGGGE